MNKPSQNWTTEEDSALRGLWDDGDVASLIAQKLTEQFGRIISKNSVIGRARRMKLDRRDPGLFREKKPMALVVRLRAPWQWNADKDARLRVLWGQGRSAQFIANTLNQEFGMSINGKVLGQRANRLGLARRKHMHPDDEMELVIPRRTEAWLALDGDATISMDELTNSTCRWPIAKAWDTSATGFCGKAVGKGVYCQHHHAIAYRPLAPKENRLEGLSRVVR